MKHRQRKLLRARAHGQRQSLHLVTRRVSRLARAASNGNLDYARRILEEGADPNARSGCPGTLPLVEAAGRGDVQMTRLLMEHGTDINAATHENVTPLIAAAYGGHIEIVSFLLSSGADAAMRDESGCTALQWARRCGHEEVALVLRQHEE